MAEKEPSLEDQAKDLSNQAQEALRTVGLKDTWFTVEEEDGEPYMTLEYYYPDYPELGRLSTNDRASLYFPAVRTIQDLADAIDAEREEWDLRAANMDPDLLVNLPFTTQIEEGFQRVSEVCHQLASDGALTASSRKLLMERWQDWDEAMKKETPERQKALAASLQENFQKLGISDRATIAFETIQGQSRLVLHYQDMKINVRHAFHSTTQTPLEMAGELCILSHGEHYSPARRNCLMALSDACRSLEKEDPRFEIPQLLANWQEHGSPFASPTLYRAVLKESGLKQVHQYIQDLHEHQKRLLAAGKDTAEKIQLPIVKDILEDMQTSLTGKPFTREYQGNWPVTDHYNAEDCKLSLRLQEQNNDFNLCLTKDLPKGLSAKECIQEIHDTMKRKSDPLLFLHFGKTRDMALEIHTYPYYENEDCGTFTLWQPDGEMYFTMSDIFNAHQDKEDPMNDLGLKHLWDQKSQEQQMHAIADALQESFDALHIPAAITVHHFLEDFDPIYQVAFPGMEDKGQQGYDIKIQTLADFAKRTKENSADYDAKRVWERKLNQRLGQPVEPLHTKAAGETKEAYRQIFIAANAANEIQNGAVPSEAYARAYEMLLGNPIKTSLKKFQVSMEKLGYSPKEVPESVAFALAVPSKKRGDSSR